MKKEQYSKISKGFDITGGMWHKIQEWVQEEFWRAALNEYGARRIAPWPREGYETYRLD